MEAVLESLTAGFPVLLLHFLVTVTMLAVGVVIYLWMTPYPELELIRNGNIAAAISLGAAILSLAIPLAFSMSVSVSVIDIIAWGLVTLAISVDCLPGDRLPHEGPAEADRGRRDGPGSPPGVCEAWRRRDHCRRRIGLRVKEHLR